MGDHNTGNQEDASVDFGDIHDLLERLNEWSPVDAEANHLLLVSFTTLGRSEQKKPVIKSLDEVFARFASTRAGSVFRLSDLDTAILIKMADFNRMETMMDLKVDLLRIIQSQLQEHFSMVDQARLIRSIDLNLKLDSAKRFLMAYGDRSKETAVDDKGQRRLNMQDIQKLRDALLKLGPKEFGKRYISSQTAALIAPGKDAKPAMTEYFVGIGKLKENILRGVDIDGTGNVFNQLTLTFDQALLYCIGSVTEGRPKTSLNMNVETVFTNAFDHYLKEGGNAGLNGVVVEFRQENMLQHFGQFQTACDLIRKNGGSVAIDNVQPETLGIVNLHRLDVKMAKIMWNGDAEDTILGAAKAIKAMQDGGTMMALAHVDNEQAVATGHKLGITLFQGYYVDDLLAGNSGGNGD